MSKFADRHDTFWRLHQTGCFVMPNPWDVGSARMMAASGAAALGTTSAGFAFTLGRPDGGTISRDEALAHAEAMVTATPLPVSGDFENGFADAPEGVAETIRLAASVGLSGCSIEDTHGPAGAHAYDFALAVERIRAASAAARSLGRPFVLCARADGVMQGRYDLAEAIRRISAFEAAGADLLYIPLLPHIEAVKQVVAAVRKPINVLAAGPMRKVPVAELAAAGVRRISLGSQIARVAHAAIRDVTREMLAEGRFDGLLEAAPGNEIDAMLETGKG